MRFSGSNKYNRPLLDRRDAELERLKKERDELRTREQRARAEAKEAHERLSQLTTMSKSFASSMRGRAEERRRARRRLDAQYTVARVLAEANGLEEAAPRILKILGDGLGWSVGVLWMVDEEAGALRCEEVWDQRGDPPAAFEAACRRASPRRGVDLPGRVWESGEPVWVEDLLRDEGFLRKEAAGEDLRGALAFPIRDTGTYGVIELFRPEVSPLDEELCQTAFLVGAQIGQFVARWGVEKERERLARESETARARLEAVLQQMPAGVFIVGHDGELLLDSAEARRIYGRRVASVEECGLYTSSYPDGGETSPETSTVTRSLKHGETVTGEEFYVRRPDGQRRVVSANSAPVRDEEGRIVAAVKAFEDITDLREAEERLRESEARFRAAFEQARVGLVQASLDGRVLVPNPGFCQIIGYAPEEAHGLHARDFTHPDDYEADMEQGRRVLEGELPGYSMEKRYVRKDGSVIWVNLTSTIARGDDGEPLYVLAIVEDIDERKRAEVALHESEERYRSLTEATSSIVWAAAGDGEVVEDLPSWQEFTGQTPGEYGGFGWLEAIHPEDREAVERIKEHASRMETVREVEYRLRHRDGEYRRVLTRVVPIRDESGEVRELICTTTDVTERIKAREERERSLLRERAARAQAEERRRISRDLHDRVAHSMGVVHQSLELHEALKERNPEAARAKIELARGMAREALDSTRNLSAELRRPEVLRGLEAALADLLRDVVPEEIGSSLSVEGDETQVSPGARDQLFLILREAVRNAVKHSGCDRLAVDLEVTPEKAVGYVEDDGLGFDPEGAISRSSNGLKSMQERTFLVGGTLDAASAPGEGTRIQVSVPLTEEA